MNKKTKLFFLLNGIGIVVFVSLFVFLQQTSLNPQQIKNKELFISLVGLPDIAISTESSFVRHRSLSNFHDIFLDAPEHIEYFPTTFSINHNIISNQKKGKN